MPYHHDVEEALSSVGTREHSLTSEYRIFGPPGTGKTTNLTRQIRRAVQRFGESSVLVTSFSRAAAAELAGQDLPISSDRIGTLHSHCWHALGRPEIAWRTLRIGIASIRISKLRPPRGLTSLTGNHPRKTLARVYATATVVSPN